MDLDFTKLNSLAFIPPERQTSKTPLEPFIEPEKYKKPPKEKRAGEGIYSVFLKAVKATSLMTSNSVFYRETEESKGA